MKQVKVKCSCGCGRTFTVPADAIGRTYHSAAAARATLKARKR